MWGRGFAAEAVKALSTHLLVKPEVRASDRVLEKAGFIRVGESWDIVPPGSVIRSDGSKVQTMGNPLIYGHQDAVFQERMSDFASSFDEPPVGSYASVGQS